MKDRTFYTCLFLIGLMFALGINAVSAATLAQTRSARAVREQQLHRDRGTVRFMLHRPWSRRHRGFMRLEKQAERRIVVELGSIRRLRLWERSLLRPKVDVGPWAATVECENRAYFELYGLAGAWRDSPGYFYLGLQFDPGTWRTAARHTGRWDTSAEAQVINAIWTARHATRDPWPNCPDPYFG